jgi:hypothetical protein
MYFARFRYALLLFFTIQCFGSSFQLKSTFNFQPLTGNIPAPSALSQRSLGIGDSPFNSISVAGIPVPAEYRDLANAYNRAAYEVTEISSLPSSVTYSTSSSGEISDASAVTAGFGPLFSTSLSLDSPAGFAGNLNMAFDCLLTTTGPREASACSMTSSLFSGGMVSNSFIVSPVSAIMDLRGNGQARWNGAQIEASGTDYTLALALAYLSTDATPVSSMITVRDGIVVSASKEQGSPFNLPVVGSSGMFAIPSVVDPVTYDFRSMASSGPIQRLSFSARAETFVVDSAVPEPGSALLIVFGCASLTLLKAGKVRRAA